MIWGKTIEQKRKAKPNIGDKKIVFAFIPTTIPDGRWVWLEYVQVKRTLGHFNEAKWTVQKRITPRQTKGPIV